MDYITNFFWPVSIKDNKKDKEKKDDPTNIFILKEKSNKSISFWVGW
jgi:hypothetical protein